MESMEVCGSESNRFQVADGYPTCAVLAVELRGSLSHVVAQQEAGGSGVGLAGHAGEFGVYSEATSGWTRRLQTEVGHVEFFWHWCFLGHEGSFANCFLLWFLLDEVELRTNLRVQILVCCEKTLDRTKTHT